MKKIYLHELSLEELLAAIENIVDAKLKLKQEQIKKEQPVYLTRNEVASLLRITAPTLHDYTRLGWLKSYRIGKRVLYREDEVYTAMKGINTNKNKKYRL